MIATAKQTVLVGDCRDVLATLPEKSVQCVVTSPPYWGLRDYQVDGMIGLEKTLDEWLSVMMEVFRGVRRVLRDDGIAWVNLGDRIIDKQGLFMPWKFALACREDGWIVCPEVIWSKPNPMRESATGRPTKSHEYVFMVTKQLRYFYDAEAVRTKTGREMTWKEREDSEYRKCRGGSPAERLLRGMGAGFGTKKDSRTHPNGASLLSVWTIPTQPFKGDHFATFPEKLVATCLKAGTSDKGCCPECGAPWKRVVARMGETGRAEGAYDRTVRNRNGSNNSTLRGAHESRTVGWEPTCDHADDPVPCRVLDPFSGAGTVGVVCKRMGLHYTGIELNPTYAEMSRRRIADPDAFGTADKPDEAQPTLFE